VKKLLFTTAALVAAVFFWILLTLPPRAISLPSMDDGTVAGIIHVHTNRSDGLSSPEDVAKAAARAGVKFLIFTDHGDATRTPDPPTYRDGVLCLDGVEISTTGGHYVAIDMPAAPYPLGGEPRDVVEDVRRLGGFGIAAHPDSPKPQLAWSDWTVPFDGVELLNPDTSWRVLLQHLGWESSWRLLSALVDYPFRSPEVMSRLIQPTTVINTWEALIRQRRVVTIAGSDAHAKLAPRNADPGDSRFALPFPGYDASFKVMSVHVRIDTKFSGRATDDAAVLMRAIRNGHLYTAVDGLATPPALTFTATNDFGTVHEGDVLGAGSPVLLHVMSNAPDGFTTIVRDGARVLSSVRDTQDLTVHAPDHPAVYWVEIVANAGAPPITWVRSNPIYVRAATSADPPKAPPAITELSSPLFDEQVQSGWNIERDAQSSGSADVVRNGHSVLRYQFTIGPSLGNYTSLVHDLPSEQRTYNGVRFIAHADRPMRLSVQVRTLSSERWLRSVYVDRTTREYTLLLDDFRLPLGASTGETPHDRALQSLMFVVDTTNAKTGTSGTVWIDRVLPVMSEP